MLTNRVSRLACALLLSAIATTIQAQSVAPVVETGLYLGGDELIDVRYVGGGGDSIDAGGLIDIAGGFVLPIGSQMETRLTVGYRFDSINGTNGSVDWQRFPVELKLFYVAPNVRLGGGLAYHMSPKLDGDGVLDGTVDFKSAFGFVGEVDYVWDFNMYLGFKFTAIDYELDEPGFRETIDGNSFGVVIGYMFY